jgi:hypothetical protein
MTQEDIDKSLSDYKLVLFKMSVRPSGWEGKILSRLTGDARQEFEDILVEFHKKCITDDPLIFDKEYMVGLSKEVNVYVKAANEVSPFRSDYRERLKAKEQGFADWYTDDRQLYAGMLLDEDTASYNNSLLQKTFTSRFRTTAYDNMQHKVDKSKEEVYRDFDGVVPEHLGSNWFPVADEVSLVGDLKELRNRLTTLIDKYKIYE